MVSFKLIQTMKKLDVILLLLVFACFYNLQAQSTVPKPPKNTLPPPPPPPIGEKVESYPHFCGTYEVQPSFPEGNRAFAKYIRKNLKYPSIARKAGVEGKVFVEFIVETDGSITNVKTIKGIGYGCDEAAEDIFRNSPKWEPGRQGKKIVQVKMSCPIVFKLGGERDRKPLIFLNGKEISTQEFEKLIPDEIKKVKIIKGQKAIEKYGERAKDGVIEIYTEIEKNIEESKTDEVYLMAEVQPKFVGGVKAFAKYLRQNLQVTYKNQGHYEGKIFIEFVVEKNGSLSNVKIIKGIEGVESNIIEVMEDSPQWIAGMRGGKTVRVKMSLPISIHDTHQEYVDERISELFGNNTKENVHIYPNPITDISNIELVLNKEMEVKIVVFDSNLKEIALVQESKKLEKGRHIFEWKTDNVSNGMYFIHIQRGSEKITQKVLVNK